MASGPAHNNQRNNSRHHAEKVVERYLEEDILEDQEAVAAVENLYSDGKVWEAVDLILDAVEQQREARSN
ncbi:hypothetical protein SAMN06269185_1191 [Natronoarchaeum philippinense]|uniref:Uncharacterized protein n=1 Tax=Natronoarchaeum philippinense TaxID=558529 RepID=A0A285NAP2_NATPI|nr:hypothetical protein [Natronoarchaeum philippinense]SNZ06499.1 hypothetical protein SAMN06269185_1191 [Natronoarchaeum philippinense]